MKKQQDSDKNSKKTPFIIWWTSFVKWMKLNPALFSSIAIGVFLIVLLLGFLPSSDPSSTPSSSISSQGSDVSSTTQISSELPPSSSETPSSSIPLVNVTISFDTQGGSSLTNLSGLPGTPVGTVVAPTRTGYDFVKFSSNALGTDTFDLTLFPNQNVTVFAIWDAQLFEVSFNEMRNTVIDYKIQSLSILYLTAEGDLYGLGRNENGIYGNGQTSSTNLTVPVLLNEFIPLNNNEKIVRIFLGSNGGDVVSFLLTNQNRVLAAGRNHLLIDNTQPQNSNITSYVDFTSRIPFEPNEAILDIFFGFEILGIRTTLNRVLVMGRGREERLFGPFDQNLVSSFTDVTSILSQDFNEGETIDLLVFSQQMGTIKTTQNRYFVWGRNGSFALMMFQPRTAIYSVPFEITADVLTLIGSDKEIVRFTPSDLVMNFLTSDFQVYNYGDYRNILYQNTTDRPTFDRTTQWGDSIPLNISIKHTLLENEVVTDIFGLGFITSMNRYHHGRFVSNVYTLGVTDLKETILTNNQTITAVLGNQRSAVLVTSEGRVYRGTDTPTLSNLTSTVLTSSALVTLALPYQSSIEYVPVRSGFMFIGWYTDQNLSSPFTGTVPLNNNLVLYTRFIPNNVS